MLAVRTLTSLSLHESGRHAGHTLASLAAQTRVGGKPMALSVEDCDKMISPCRGEGI